MLQERDRVWGNRRNRRWSKEADILKHLAIFADVLSYQADTYATGSSKVLSTGGIHVFTPRTVTRFDADENHMKVPA